MLPVHQFGINNHIYPLLPVHLQAGLALPDHVRLGLICNSISHRAYRLGGAQMKVWEEKFYRYRGLIIRSLAADIADERKHASFVTIAGVMSLLLSDVRLPHTDREACRTRQARLLTTLDSYRTSKLPHLIGLVISR